MKHPKYKGLLPPRVPAGCGCDLVYLTTPSRKL